MEIANSENQEIDTYTNENYVFSIMRTAHGVHYIFLDGEKEVVLTDNLPSNENLFERFVRLIAENGVFDTLHKESYSKLLSIDIEKQLSTKKKLTRQIADISHNLEVKQAQLSSLEERYKKFKERYSNVVEEYIDYIEQPDETEIV